jgi:hypothetical protein
MQVTPTLFIATLAVVLYHRLGRHHKPAQGGSALPPPCTTSLFVLPITLVTRLLTALDG